MRRSEFELHQFQNADASSKDVSVENDEHSFIRISEHCKFVNQKDKSAGLWTCISPIRFLMSAIWQVVNFSLAQRLKTCCATTKSSEFI
jgi:hypothetical protein